MLTSVRKRLHCAIDPLSSLLLSTSKSMCIWMSRLNSLIPLLFENMFLVFVFVCVWVCRSYLVSSTSDLHENMAKMPYARGRKTKVRSVPDESNNHDYKASCQKVCLPHCRRSSYLPGNFHFLIYLHWLK